MGTLVLNDVLGYKFDFLVLSSSLSSVLGGFGQVDCAANAFLDEFAHRNTSINGQFTVATGILGKKSAWQLILLPDELKSGEKRALKWALSTEAVDAFSRILGSSLSQVVVSRKIYKR